MPWSAFQGALSSFHRILQGMGYQEVLLAARPLTDLPVEKKQKLDALAEGVPASIHLVDVRA